MVTTNTEWGVTFGNLTKTEPTNAIVSEIQANRVEDDSFNLTTITFSVPNGSLSLHHLPTELPSLLAVAAWGHGEVERDNHRGRFGRNDTDYFTRALLLTSGYQDTALLILKKNRRAVRHNPFPERTDAGSTVTMVSGTGHH
ncbi:MAG: hypothetical protein OK455_00795 [Thaumarchaeota archaeon]|nr:hypothetical protein [Nitrososphaerota archaeon]